MMTSNPLRGVQDNMIAEVKSTPDFRKKENRRKPEITVSFNGLAKNSKKLALASWLVWGGFVLWRQSP